MPLIDALELGAPGCISATANLNAQAIAEVVTLYDSGDLAGAHAAHANVRRFREALEQQGPIPAQKRLLAIATGDARWANVRPPLMAMPEPEGQALSDALRREFGEDTLRY
jgi:4-hydroxy-tetrahydrodipicolinate synthase